MALKNKRTKPESYNMNEYVSYLHKLTEKERKYIRQFYKEYYKADFYSNSEELIIKDKDMRKEAVHNHNAKNLDVINKMDTQDPYLDEKVKAFMEDASDDWEWQDAFKTLGYKLAVDTILCFALENLNNKFLNKKNVLLKFHIKMDKLRILNNRDKLNKKTGKDFKN